MRNRRLPAVLLCFSLLALTACEAALEAATTGIEGDYEAPALTYVTDSAERRVVDDEQSAIAEARILPAAEIDWRGLYPYGPELLPHANSNPSGMEIVVARHLYVDDTRTSRVGVVPSPDATPGQVFRLTATMETDVRFRVEARYYAPNNDIIHTDTSAPFVDGPGTSQLISRAPLGTDYMLLRIYLDDVDFGEVHTVAAALLERAEGFVEVETPVGPTVPSPTTTARPTTTVTSAPTTTRPPATTTTRPPATTQPPATTTTRPPATTQPPATTTTRPPATTQPPSGTPLAFTLDASNTGVVGGQNAGVCSNNLTQYSGQLVIDNAWVNQNGNVLENFDIDGALLIKADNVTFRCGRVDGSWAYSIDNKARGTVFEWIEADQNDDGKTILGGNYTAYRCNVHGGEDSIHINTGTVAITECYVHDQNFIGHDPHPDAIQVTSGGSVQNVTVVRSKLISFYKAPNAALQINVVNSWSITDSYLWGGVYSILGDPGNPGVVTNNYFGWDSSQYGAIGGVSASRSGNVWWEWISPRCSGAYSASNCATPASHPGNGTPI